MTTSMRMLLGSVLLAAGAVAGYANESPSSLALRTERVIAFKDGYSLIVKSGTALADDKGEVHTDEVPEAAILGAFWAFAEREHIAGMRVGWRNEETVIEEAVSCLEPIEILDANRGKACRVVMGDAREYSGIVRDVLTWDVAKERQRGREASSYEDRDQARPIVRTSGIEGSRFVLRSESGDVLLRADEIRALTIENMVTERRQTTTTTTRRKHLSIRFDGARREHRVTLIYFAPGIRWIPTYRVQLSPGHTKRAQVSLQAELLNESQDLRSVPLDLVVGVPHFRFRDVVSPFVLEGKLWKPLEKAAPELMAQMQSGSRGGEGFIHLVPGAARDRSAYGTLDLANTLTAAGSQDLFVYNLPPVTVAKGERIAVPIFDADVPCRHVYTWDVHLKRTVLATAPSAAGVSPLSLSDNRVWHQLELTNATKVPWTTGPAIAMEDGLPLGQDLLTHTPIGGRVRIPVTVAVDARGSYSEAQIEQVPEALEWANEEYVKVSNRVQLELRNFKDESVDAEITLRFGGRADAASDGGRVSLRAHESEDWEDYRGSRAVNNSSTVSWAQSVAAGKAFAPSVDYHYFARP